VAGSGLGCSEDHDDVSALCCLGDSYLGAVPYLYRSCRSGRSCYIDVTGDNNRQAPGTAVGAHVPCLRPGCGEPVEKVPACHLLARVGGGALWFGMTTQSRNLSLYRSCKPVARRGFTLVELVIVLVVLAVVAALVVPTFQALVSESRGKSEELTLMAVHRQATAHMLADGRTTYIDEDVEQAVGDLPAAFAGVTVGVSAEGSPRFKIRNVRVVSPGPRDPVLDAPDLVPATVVGTSVETALQPGELAYDILDSGSTLVLMMASADGVTPVFAGGPANGAVSWRVKGAGSSCVLSAGARPANTVGEDAVCAPPEGLEGSGGGSSEGGAGVGGGGPTGVLGGAGLGLSYPAVSFDTGLVSQQFEPVVEGGTGGFSYQLEGELPPGVSFDAATGVLSGPSVWGDFLDGVSDLAPGGSHACALKSGEVFCWGTNGSGQLGDASSTTRLTPVKVLDGAMGNSGVSQIALGSSHTCALKSGEVFCWGSNSSGQLGDGTTSTRNIPVKVSAGAMTNSGVSQIALGSSHTCALKSGEVFCWGFNGSGQLGDGTTSTRTSPVEVSAGAMTNSGVSQIALGSSHTCALKNDKVFCWGDNGSGGLGDGTFTTRTSPVEVLYSPVGLFENTTVTQVVTGGSHACALKSGEVFCWGTNGSGQLGDASSTTRLTPVKVLDGAMGNSGVSQIALGSSHTCALKSGEVFCWGSNSSGQLGDGTTSTRNIPVKVSAGAMTNSGVSQIALGSSHTCTLKSGEVFCWGFNGSGQLGDGSQSTRNIPVKVSAGAMTNSGVSQIALGSSHTCALKNDKVFCWGDNGSGGLGDGTFTTRTSPVEVLYSPVGLFENTTVTQVVTGGSHACALKSGEVFCWGTNGSGQLGDASSTTRLTPVKVLDGAMGNSGVSQIALGSSHTCALKSGEVFCWGSNSSGQLGDGTTSTRNIPVKVSAGAMTNSGVSQIALGSSHTCTLKSGEVFCWGFNGSGQLGDGSQSTRNIPVKVSAGAMTNSGVSQIALGSSHTCALKNDKVFCWGDNGSGGLGDGTFTTRTSPVEVLYSPVGLFENTTVTQVVTGGSHACALKSGEVFCWGTNGSGQLGDASSTTRLTPVKVLDGAMGNSGVSQIALGSSHTCALKSGEVFCWGSNSSGQLGDGTTSTRNIPVKVSAGAMTNSGVSQIALGSSHTCTLKSGEVFCWGFNGSGQLGDGSQSTRNIPVKVSAGAMTNSGVSQIALGSSHTCALKNDKVFLLGGQRVRWAR
jgi:prepilin-type N-terminal cleavage/methylation domain-containing protein